MIGKVGDRTAF